MRMTDDDNDDDECENDDDDNALGNDNDDVVDGNDDDNDDDECENDDDDNALGNDNDDVVDGNDDDDDGKRRVRRYRVAIFSFHEKGKKQKQKKTNAEFEKSWLSGGPKVNILSDILTF